ncbi:MAG TPA: hypothetical protein VF086_01260 [Propionibacteriaceae bacterium]
MLAYYNSPFQMRDWNTLKVQERLDPRRPRKDIEMHEKIEIRDRDNAEKVEIQNRDYTEGHSRVLVGSGILLFLASLINGFFIHGAALPRLALSAHVLGLISSAMLLGLGSFWPRLNLSRKISALGSILAIYGFCTGWIVYFSAAVLGAGGMFPMLGGRRGIPVVEQFISIGMLTVVLTLFTFGVIVIIGLRAHNKS